MTIESPCILVCHLDPVSGICIGCGRTGEEIAGWLGYSPQRRRELMACLPERLAALPAAEPERRATTR